MRAITTAVASGKGGSGRPHFPLISLVFLPELERKSSFLTRMLAQQMFILHLEKNYRHAY